MTMRQKAFDFLGWLFCEAAFFGWQHRSKVGGFIDRLSSRLYDIGVSFYRRTA